MPVLQSRQLFKDFGTVEVLKDINLSIEKGEFRVLVGPSGCGKATLLNIVAGLETASAGDILIDDRVVNEVAPKDRDIAMVFQSYALYPNMTVAKNISFGLEMRKVPKAERDEAVARVSKMLQIDPLLKRKPSQLSGGQRQRVAIARALITDPDLVIADEPTANLDSANAVRIIDLMREINHTTGAAFIFSTHDQRLLDRVDRRVHLQDGLIVEDISSGSDGEKGSGT